MDVRTGVSEGRAHPFRRSAKVIWWTLTLQLPRRLRDRREATRHAERARKSPDELYEEWVREFDTLTKSDLEGMRAVYQGIERRPLVSVLMPIFSPREEHLRAAVESILAQVYADWELCLADASTAPQVKQMLDDYERQDDRVHVLRQPHGSPAPNPWNTALECARGELVALVDQDDVLRPHSLLLSVLAFDVGPGVGLVYSDEDRVDDAGKRSLHDFKPDWNPTLLLCQGYACRLMLVRTALVRTMGGFRGEYSESNDWDLALRVTERLPRDGIAHVPHVLCHRRAGRDSRKSQAAQRAVEDHLERTGRRGQVVPVGSDQKVRFLSASDGRRITVIVPSTGRPDLLEPCIEGVMSRTTVDQLELVIVVDESARSDPSNRGFLAKLADRPHVRVQTYPSRAFNYALTVNEAVAATSTEFVLLLNDDIDVVRGDWLEALLGYAQEDDVGAVGGMLVYPDGTIHSAGMLVGAREIAENRYHRRPADIHGYANRARLPQDLAAVVGTCMLVRREAFDEVGGLDVSFPVAYNDVDFCLKLRRAGWRIVYVPDALLIHRGSASFGTHQRGRETDHGVDAERMVDRWQDVLQDDPMHNPNLALDPSYPDRLAFPPRVAYPWRRRADGSIDA